ncbi:MAG: AAA family ATPase [Candidatus Omnitrophica bacterium]|jgi:general secretion pathway protein A|nr:AAA family ATPase [Candidatus Omnitrophota bacterium]MDD4012642.1 AAA family ATPase [Candidatus Omnitrophota bacterium]
MYLSYYGLKENPFNVTSDPSFLYLSHTHKEALDHLLFGIDRRKGFIEITGEIGCGKTTLCRALLSRLDTTVKTSVIFNSTLPEAQLLEAIVEDFGLKPEKRGKGASIMALNRFLLEQLREGNNAVLIIDEAQNLRPTALETIRMLSTLETEKEKLLQIILVGQPQLIKKLDSPGLEQLKQRISVRFHVKPLEPGEISNYIDYRLRIAGSDGKIKFLPETIDSICAYTKGVPRLINLLCDKALLLGFVRETSTIDPDMIQMGIEEIEGLIIVNSGGKK